MKFSEKIQMLRKSKKMSQEQLADLMDVSRQAVSKWESGTAYPEMDKLLTLCKIFDCTLDDLTNDSVSEINVGKSQKITTSNLVEQFLHTIKLIYLKMTNMSFKEIIKMFLEIAFLLVLLFIIKIPIGMIARKVLLVPVLGYILYCLIYLIYLILAIIIFGYIFKLRYLDTLELENKVEKEKEKKSQLAEKENKSEIKVIEQKKGIFDILASILLFFIKFIVGIIGISLIILLVLLSVILAIFVIAAFNKILFLGVILGIIAAFIICVIFLEVAVYFIFNNKIHLKKIFIVLVISLCLMGIGIGMTVYDVSKLEVIDQKPIEYKNQEVKKEFNYVDDLYINTSNICYEYYHGMDKYQVDSSLPDNKVVIKYVKSKYNDLSFDVEDKQINLYEESSYNYKEIYDLVIKNLKKKKIYNYEIECNNKVVIMGNEKVIKQLKATEEVKLDEYYKNNYNDELNACYTEKDNLFEQYYSLQDENEELKEEIAEYKEQLRLIKEQLD